MSDQHPEWVRSSVFYQIFPDRFANGDPGNDPPGVAPWGAEPWRDNFFGGDLAGILGRLPYLQELGVNAIYLTPVFQAGSNHKYDTCDYRAIDPAFGTLEQMREMVAAAHRRGMRVVLDAVFNHCGDGFWAFRDVLERGEASPYAGWFQAAEFPLRQDPPNYQTCGGAAYLPKFNFSNPQVRQYLLETATYWMRQCEVDGWRLDVPWKVPLDFWRDFRQAVKRVRPDAYIVGEVWRDAAPWLAGDTCDGIMNYPWREYLLDYCVRDAMDAEDFDHFSARLRAEYGPRAAYHLNLLGSHDTARLLTLCGGDEARAIVATAALFTSPGAPLIYYGDEIGLQGGNDPGCRGCMTWDESQWNRRIFGAFRALVRARREHPALSEGRFETLWTFNGVYAYRRICEQDEVLICLNPREERRLMTIPLPGRPPARRRWRDLLTGTVYESDERGLRIEILRSRSALILA